MRKQLLFLLGMLLTLPTAALAQWEFQGVFPPDPDLQFSSTHGIAVDPDGKVWIQPFGATDSVQVPALGDTYQPVRVIYVFNADGTPAEFSPVKFVDLPGGERDTLGGLLVTDENGNKAWEQKSGRGLRADADGNILVMQFNYLYRLNYQTGAGMNRIVTEGGSKAAPAVATETGNIFVAPVVPGGPIVEYAPDFSVIGNAVDVTYGFSRSFEVSPDGNRIFWAGYTLNGVIEYARPDEFSGFDSLGVVIPGVDSESMTYNPATGNLWVAAGSPNDLPNDFEGFTTRWLPQTWYAFDIDNLVPNTVPEPLGSITWSNDEAIYEGFVDGRPRGLAFSPDGNTAYVAQFSQIAPSVQVFTRAEGVALPVDRLDEVPTKFALKQNYPNPFNPSTKIEFALTQPGHARLAVYDVLGREVAVLVDEPLTAGTYTKTFDARNLPSGMYLYTLDVDGQRLNGTMTLLR